MLEVRIIHKDGTCAVFKNVAYVRFDDDCLKITTKLDFEYTLSWDYYKSIKVVKK